MGKKSSCKRFKAFVTVLSQNMRGLKTGEVRVQRAQQRDELGRHAVPQEHLPQHLARHTVEGLDEVDEHDPRLEAVLAPLAQRLLESDARSVW